ncbi:hypothetical protein [Paenibacillus cookii]|uniref:Uncharacterized protein n=1 Tax=Paenibacillus cookii TaxID=157839 RepID=A0ABQ4M0Z1_9BACL|nr:hypothetical protein [Paenibacillus cookii]GIO68808.1 hypothetical protein J21TS3_36290 [Paenibacillus cookii]
MINIGTYRSHVLRYWVTNMGHVRKEPPERGLCADVPVFFRGGPGHLRRTKLASFILENFFNKMLDDERLVMI